LHRDDKKSSVHSTPKNHPFPQPPKVVFTMQELYGLDAFSPTQIAERVEAIGVTKARLPLLSMIMLGIMAGFFIGLGGLYFTLVTADASLGFAAARLLGGFAFSLGPVETVKFENPQKI
jgi:hypothetical protein